MAPCYVKFFNPFLPQHPLTTRNPYHSQHNSQLHITVLRMKRATNVLCPQAYVLRITHYVAGSL